MTGMLSPPQLWSLSFFVRCLFLSEEKFAKMKHLQVDVAGNAMSLPDGVDLAGDAVDAY